MPIASCDLLILDLDFDFLLLGTATVQLHVLIIEILFPLNEWSFKYWAIVIIGP